MPSSIGDLTALGSLLQEHRPKLLEMLRRRIDPALSVRIDAEEILSEAFFVAQRKYPEFKQQSSITPYAWLYRITLDCLIEAWRRETRGRRDLGLEIAFPAESSIQLALGLVDTGTSPSAAVQRNQLQQRMRQVLELLSSRDREILTMRHYDQLSHREAAEVLGITESAATLRYVRALKRLRDLWTKLHGEIE